MARAKPDSPAGISGQVEDEKFGLDNETLRRLALQRVLGALFLLPLGAFIIGLIRWRFKLSLPNLRAIRHQFREITATPGPILICPNHLTMVDSVIILWVLAPLHRYLFNYRLFSWNIPAIENYRSNKSWLIVTYLSKCIAIERSGGSDHIDSVFGQLKYLLARGELCTVFPEGTRSRTGRIEVENATYGVGKLVQAVPGTRVLCIYLRGRRQEQHSTFPVKGDTLHLSMELITPTSRHTGLRAVKDYSQQTILKLKELENAYFGEEQQCSQAVGDVLNRQ